MKKDHIIFAYSFDKVGQAKKLDKTAVAEELENDGLSWVHLDTESKLTKFWLESEVSYLDHLIIDALLAEETRPRLVEFEKGILIILRSANLNPNSTPEDMVSLRIWIDECRIITVQRRRMGAVFGLAQDIEEGKTIKNSAEFLYNLIYGSINETLSSVYALTDKLDVLEDKIFNTHDVQFREQVIKIRGQSSTFKRYMMPQKEVIRKLQLSEQNWINDWARRHFQENHEIITRMIEEANEAYERSQILHEELSNALSERLNRSMYKLSIITSIFMPLTFITGIFGMNIGGLPGLGEPQAFNLCMVGMLIVFMIQILFFKRGKWF